MSLAALKTDFVARLCDAWDCRGTHPFRGSGVEHRALLALAGLPLDLADRRWKDLDEGARWQLIVGAKAAIELGRHCAWVFGEGQGAR